VVPSSSSQAASGLQVRAALGPEFTGSYALTSPTGAALATVDVYLTAAAYRVDVVEKTATTSLYGGTARETVACTVAPGIPTVCYDVAEPGAKIPARFDVGVERVFRDDLPALATSVTGLDVQPAALLSTLTSPVAKTQCYTVTAAGGSTAAGVDAGTYCLDPAGLLVGFSSTSGVLTLTRHSAAPAAAALRPPATPQALPSPATG
jgi:hypothetical protein